MSIIDTSSPFNDPGPRPPDPGWDDLVPVAAAEPNDHGSTTVWVDWPTADVDRPRTFGISVSNPRNVARLVRAINDGAVMYDVSIKTDIHGQTYVACNSRVFAKYLNADLTRLGY